jgi:hypothetical protein
LDADCLPGDQRAVVTQYDPGVCHHPDPPIVTLQTFNLTNFITIQTLQTL